MIPANQRQIFLSGLFLWLFAVVGTTLVAFAEFASSDAIVENERRVLLRNLHALLPPDELDNDIAADTLRLPPSPLLGTDEESTAYRARLDGEPVAVIFNSIAPDGYNGRIHLLVGVYVDGRLAGVRVVKHAETPGLGDGIEIRKSPWIRSFDGKSLQNPAPGTGPSGATAANSISSPVPRSRRAPWSPRSGTRCCIIGKTLI